tara:strand:- start:523 stop:1236 length:714 start_codon:yes stop_codon:yes gene_type:complete
MKRFTSPFRKDWTLGPILTAWLDRLEGVFQTRAPESIPSTIAAIEPGQVVMLAPDTWEVGAPIPIRKSCTIVGSGLGTKIKAGASFTGAALFDVDAENVVIKDVSFDGNGVSAAAVKSTRNGLSVFGCKIEGLGSGVSVDGGHGALVSHCYISCTTAGVSISGTSSSNRINGNHIQVSGASGQGIVLGSSVSYTSVVGNVSNKEIEFHNTGGAQSFAAPGNLGNHVAGNAAVLDEKT